MNTTLFDRAVEQIERGREGLNKGIPIPFSRLRKYLPNIQQKTYYLIGAATKVGKTSFADDLFFYGAYDYVSANPDLDIVLDIDYFSYEIDSETKIVKGITRKIWHDYGVITDVNTILSRGENWCNDETYNIVRKYKNYFDKMANMVTVHDMKDNPTGMYKYLIRKAKANGTIIEKKIGTDINGKAVMRFGSYTPNSANRYWIIIIDHIGLLREERGFSTKQIIDKMSQYLVELRNNYGAIPVVIQQLAFDSENDERYKQKRLTPTLKDFGDSKYTTRDANVIMALFNPFKHNLEKFQGYNIMALGNTFRSLEIIENRDGEPNINVGLNFIGPAGTFRELPKPDQMTSPFNQYAVDMVNNKSQYKQNNEGLWIQRE